MGKDITNVYIAFFALMAIGRFLLTMTSQELKGKQLNFELINSIVEKRAQNREKKPNGNRDYQYILGHTILQLWAGRLLLLSIKLLTLDSAFWF